MKKLNKYFLIFIVLIFYSFIQFYGWFEYSTLISNFKNRKNKITKIEEKKDSVISVFKNNNKVPIEEYEKRFKKIIKYLPSKNEELGYISDYNNSKDSNIDYVLAQYVLSPHIIKLSSKKNYLIGNFSKKISEEKIIDNKKYIFCEENEKKRNFNEIINYSKTNNNIKNEWPKDKTVIYSPFFKRSGNKVKKYNCMSDANFTIVKEFDDGVMLIQRD